MTIIELQRRKIREERPDLAEYQFLSDYCRAERISRATAYNRAKAKRIELIKVKGLQHTLTMVKKTER